jgi:hypothetical protein
LKYVTTFVFTPFQFNERPKSTGDGPTQRASALAALSNVFNPSSKPKTRPPSHSGQGSQRAAAVAALSSVLIAEPSGSSENLRASKTSSTADKTGRPAPSFSIHRLYRLAVIFSHFTV